MHLGEGNSFNAYITGRHVIQQISSNACGFVYVTDFDVNLLLKRRYYWNSNPLLQS